MVTVVSMTVKILIIMSLALRGSLVGKNNNTHAHDPRLLLPLSSRHLIPSEDMDKSQTQCVKLTVTVVTVTVVVVAAAVVTDNSNNNSTVS